MSAFGPQERAPQTATSFMQTRLAVSLIFAPATNFRRMSANDPKRTLALRETFVVPMPLFDPDDRQF
jgi:hypothetical protein